MVCSAGRFVVCLTVCHFLLVFFGPFSVAVASLEEERCGLGAFRTFVRFVLVWPLILSSLIFFCLPFFSSFQIFLAETSLKHT